ncbi:MAG: 4-hydroxybenzoate polyprenyltransferase [Crocinitomicaceae bacterium]|jgi:4-hydroxybenzoate polyprenyltransferase
MSFIHLFTKKLRLSKPWKYKVPLIISLPAFFILVGDFKAETALFSYIAAIVTTIGFAGIGYITNDLSDRKKDGLAGKDNVTAKLSIFPLILITVLFLGLALGPWFYLPLDRISIGLIAAELLLFVLYAFPPFRLKEKGVIGLLADALYAHVVPAILASWTFFIAGGKEYEYMLPFLITLGIWQLVSGIRNILSHQIKDYHNDLKSGISTYVTKRGLEGLEPKLRKYMMPLEVMLFIAIMLFIQIEVTYLLPILSLYWLVALYRFPKTIEDKSETEFKHNTNVFLDNFYIKWLPTIIVSNGIFINMEIRYILLIHIILFTPVISFAWKKIRKVIG